MFPRTPNLEGARSAVRVSTNLDGRVLSDPVVREGVVALWKEMKTKLEDGLKTQEVEYYNAIADLRGGSSPKISYSAHMKGAYDRAVSDTEAAYKKAGLA